MGKESLPIGLQSFTFLDSRFNLSMEQVSLPTGLQSVTFGAYFSQTIEKESMPTGQQILTFLDYRFNLRAYFNQSILKVSLPTGLQSFSFWLGIQPRHREGGSADWPAEPHFP